jgi:hypothetical protein
MGRQKWEALQKDVEVAFKPLVTRRDYYRNGIITLNQLLTTYFLNVDLSTSLIEAAKVGEQVFDFNRFKAGIALCLSDEETLARKAVELKDSQQSDKISLVGALDEQISTSKLPIYKNAEGDYFCHVDQPYTPKAQAFMKQFCYALGLYRVYLNLFEAYFELLNYPFLQVEESRTCLNAADSLLSQLSSVQDENGLLTIWHQAKREKTTIKSLMTQLRDEADRFDNTFLLETSRLVTLFNRGCVLLESCYREFPNESKLFFVKDTPWQILLKTIAVFLFDNTYTYSSYNCTLTIKPEFFEKVLGEVTRFHQEALAKQLEYKLELLSRAMRIQDDVLLQVRQQAARIGLPLVSTSASSSDPGSNPNSFHYMRYWPDSRKPVEPESHSPTYLTH